MRVCFSASILADSETAQTSIQVFEILRFKVTDFISPKKTGNGFLEPISMPIVCPTFSSCAVASSSFTDITNLHSPCSPNFFRSEKFTKIPVTFPNPVTLNF